MPNSNPSLSLQRFDPRFGGYAEIATDVSLESLVESAREAQRANPQHQFRIVDWYSKIIWTS